MHYSLKKYKYVIVDSQPDAIVELQNHMKDYGQYVCVGVAKNSEEAIHIIIDKTPNLVFFDPEIMVQGVKECSFGIISETYQLLKRLPHFIAMSNSTALSYKAIKKGVFDYLLKPFNYYECKKALIRFENTQPEAEIICIKSFTEYRFMELNDIIYLKADNNTTDFFLKDGTMVTSFNTLKHFEVELPNTFARIHKSYIINMMHLTKIHFSKFQCSLKHTNIFIPFSKSLKSKMMEIKDLMMNGFIENTAQSIKSA
ncbi:LytTR family transcriptional regulator DNA-binding domain-containing protein [Lutibacter sp. A64]|uniref:LytR/AlgR family response regulator transcription factor n=1 Tax=Lutibacter sp. A64 TaxID=2918526 RepID=UPI001F06B66B|nr:response regulator transcription factor [Lutibacter sp. A64]UMB53915.1 LytTR family transcriptional regulator DNA-binding domain-containing protein [Lutibacter sp. A64]